MGRRVALAAVVAVAVALMTGVRAFGHSGDDASSISVEPPTVTAGGTVVLAGVGLEPDSDREISLVGPDVVVPFPTATTDADGMFSETLTIPAHLPAGIYTFRAIADETLTTDLTVTAAAGVAAPEPPNEAAAVVVAHDRSPVELAIIAGLVVVVLVLGVTLVTRAERVGHPA